MDQVAFFEFVSSAGALGLISLAAWWLWNQYTANNTAIKLMNEQLQLRVDRLEKENVELKVELAQVREQLNFQERENHIEQKLDLILSKISV